MNPDTETDEPSDVELEPSESEPSEPDEPSDLDFTDMPCTDAGSGTDESPWEAFLPDDDQWDPEPEPGDFWIDYRLLVSPSLCLHV
jgi:hypothetical protein